MIFWRCRYPPRGRCGGRRGVGAQQCTAAWRPPRLRPLLRRTARRMRSSVAAAPFRVDVQNLRRDSTSLSMRSDAQGPAISIGNKPAAPKTTSIQLHSLQAASSLERLYICTSCQAASATAWPASASSAAGSSDISFRRSRWRHPAANTAPLLLLVYSSLGPALAYRGAKHSAGHSGCSASRVQTQVALCRVCVQQLWRVPRASACRCRVGSRAAGSGSTKRTQSPDSRPSRYGATDQASSPPEQAGFSAVRIATAEPQASRRAADHCRGVAGASQATKTLCGCIDSRHAAHYSLYYFGKGVQFGAPD